MPYHAATRTHYRGNDPDLPEVAAHDQAKGIFDRYDKDKSGFMERKEIRAMIDETFGAFGMETTEKDIDDMLNLLDKDGDGKVSRKSLSLGIHWLLFFPIQTDERKPIPSFDHKVRIAYKRFPIFS